MEIFEKIAGIVKRYEEINEALAEPDILNDMERYRQLLKERSQMEVIVGTYHQYRELETELDDLEIMLQDEDAELREMSRQEMFVIKEKQHDLEAEMKELLLPADPNDRKDAILEIRAGTGGDEASLFAGDLLRMYLRHAERCGWRVETISVNDTEMGGIKEIILSVSGRGGVYGRLRFESGVHRVQRVPVTETQGRIQTSAATVAVLPDVEDVQIEIKETDLRVDTYRSSGAGGQHVNKTESAIRITHIPTGIVVQCQDERSQFKNRDKAMRVLKSRLYDFYAKQQEASLESQRRSMVGSGDRSERIRTYNFPQGRVTDHRIGLTLHKIDQIMDGDLDELIDALVIADRAERLGSIEGE